MKQTLRQQAQRIISASISAVVPDEAVLRALKGITFPGKVILVAVGKAAWQMAKTARDCLGSRISDGIVITKYGHVKSPLEGIRCMEAGHPVPDENSFRGTEAALELVKNLTEQDTVLFLLSGGGSALFEKPLISAEELQSITSQLLRSGADIVEINTVRKRLSGVKGGRFAQACFPARVYGIVLSDIIGDPLDMIASGPAAPDSSTCAQALEIAEKYGLILSDDARRCLCRETPKVLSNVRCCVSGSVRELCQAAAAAAQELGYEPRILTDRLDCQAKEAGRMLAALARENAGKKLALIAGGETVVGDRYRERRQKSGTGAGSGGNH